MFQEKCAADMERLQRELERTQAQLQSNRTQLQQAEQAQEKARADVLDKQLEMEGLQVRGVTTAVAEKRNKNQYEIT